MRCGASCRQAHDAIEAATGGRPRGFRGPGFSLSEGTLAALVELGYRYDASTLPTFIGTAGAGLLLPHRRDLGRGEGAARRPVRGLARRLPPHPALPLASRVGVTGGGPGDHDARVPPALPLLVPPLRGGAVGTPGRCLPRDGAAPVPPGPGAALAAAAPARLPRAERGFRAWTSSPAWPRRSRPSGAASIGSWVRWGGGSSCARWGNTWPPSGTASRVRDSPLPQLRHRPGPAASAGAARARRSGSRTRAPGYPGERWLGSPCPSRAPARRGASSPGRAATGDHTSGTRSWR